VGLRSWTSLRWFATAAAIVASTGALAACGSSDDSNTGSTGATAAATGADTTASASTQATTECSGEPVVLSAFTNLTSPVSIQQPSYFAGIKAAAEAVNKDCTLGAPIKVITCDDQFNPNQGAKCARQAVADKSAAVLSYGGLGDTYGPIVTKAGIPIMPATATSGVENSSPMSFPFGFPIANLLGQVQLGAATGGKKVTVITFDLPAAEFFVKAAKGAAAQYGMSFTDDVRVPLTATDMTPFAAQAKAAGGDTFIIILGQLQLVPLVKAMNAAGVDLTQTRVIAGMNTILPAGAKDIGSGVNGFLSASWVVPPSETDNPVIKQYLSELDAAGEKSGPEDVDMLGVEGWAEVHILADTLKEQGLEPTPANIAKALAGATNMPELSQKYGLSPVDFTKPAYPSGPLSKLRLFSNQNTFWEYDADGIPQPLADGKDIATTETGLQITRPSAG
jgi:branched-chain amino acid transport system substrate-binding protein